MLQIRWRGEVRVVCVLDGMENGGGRDEEETGTGVWVGSKGP